jgi:pimeloyl-ACP methyl ester carboxylesterase
MRCILSGTATSIVLSILTIGMPSVVNAETREDRTVDARCDDRKAADIVGQELQNIADFPETVLISPPNRNALYYNLVMREPHEAPASHRIYYGSALPQFGDLRLPKGRGPFPVAVVIHGGGWGASVNLHYMASLAASLTCAGVATWNIEYRRAGSGGDWPALFKDVAGATDFLRELAQRYPLDLSRGVVSIGHSAGGHLALWLAMRHKLAGNSDLFTPNPLPIAGAVSLDGVPNLFAFVAAFPVPYQATFQVLFGTGGASPALIAQRMSDASPESHLPLGVRQVLIQGNPGGVPPFGCCGIPEYVAEAQAKGDNIQYVVVDGFHFASVDPSNPQSGPVVRSAVQSMLDLRDDED